ncbi:MAG: carbamoyl-phosphate synthase large subunit [Chloroflexota bacterium]|nr:carbamoyl-phosphate synthase large subunit [Chloroflexota bacterium]
MTTPDLTTPAPPRTVFVIGSGPIVIGQAAEFDYAGTQACRALREEGVRVVLVNSNPATIMTDEDIADVVYIEPLTVDVLKRIIQRERPDGLLPTLGGQTGLNLAVQLADAGILEKYNVRLLGTPLEAIKKAEDRALFKETLESLGEPAIASAICHTLEEAQAFAQSVPPPLIVRPAYTLGGTGGGIADTWDDLDAKVLAGLHASPIHQILLERSLRGWKEVEYEVMRDSADTCITICNMENFDPVGVHTGDSIVVAPSQTLSDRDYQMLRSASLRIIRALGIEGGCNIQFALDPRSSQYYVIEVNPRVSRSSALASKATGYPIARVAAKIAIGKLLREIPNAVTAKTTAAFEPALDYCVLKIPRWPFDKFYRAERTIGTQMKATGEVMAIDRSFEAAIQKAVRSLEWDDRDLGWEEKAWDGPDGADMLDDLVRRPNDQRLWALMASLRRGMPADTVAAQTGIDPWFMRRLATIVQMEGRIQSEPLTDELLWEAKRSGFGDAWLGRLTETSEAAIAARRRAVGIVPVCKMVDTCAAEFDAATPYFYTTYEDENEAEPLPGPKAVVIGSGPIRIGQGIEFDYSCVQAAHALHAANVRSIMLNNNPETVSTDFDTSDRLYITPLDEEGVMDILYHEGTGFPTPPPPFPRREGGIADDDVLVSATRTGVTAVSAVAVASESSGTQVERSPLSRVRAEGQEVGAAPNVPPVVLQFGGQTAINLAGPLAALGVPILGSGQEAIDLAEDRKRFEKFLRQVGIPQPPGTAVRTLLDAEIAAEAIGYPVLVRPSYVLGGRAMEVVHTEEDLRAYLSRAVLLSDKPVLIDKYLAGKEVEVDAICDGTDVLIPGVMEHIERAGVHSGDSFAVYPGVNLYPTEVEQVVEYTTRIALAMGVRGLMNIQYVIYRARLYVIEVNPRASRTVPFLSKVTGVPMVKLATNIMLGKSLKEQGYTGGLWPRRPLVAVKAPVFSMAKLRGVEVGLGPEMKSTGEAMGIDRAFAPAFIKAIAAAGMSLPERGSVVVSLQDSDKTDEYAEIMEMLVRMGFHTYATEGTAAWLEAHGIPVPAVAHRIGKGSPDMLDLISNGTVHAVINTPGPVDREIADAFLMRRAAVERGIPCITSMDTARAMIEAMRVGNEAYTVQPLPDYRSFVGRGY